MKEMKFLLQNQGPIQDFQMGVGGAKDYVHARIARHEGEIPYGRHPGPD